MKKNDTFDSVSKCLTDNEYIMVFIRVIVSVSHCDELQTFPYFHIANLSLQPVVKARWSFLESVQGVDADYRSLLVQPAAVNPNQSKRPDWS